MHLYDFSTARQIAADRRDRLADEMARDASWLRRPRRVRGRRAHRELTVGAPAP